MIENHREEVYIQSLVEDMEADVKQTSSLINDISTRISLSDSLLAALSSGEVQTNSNKAHKLWLMTIGFPDFVQNDRTIQQLKSSGALRIIRKKGVSDKIMEYDQAVRQLSVTQTNMNSIAANTTMFSQVFDFINLKQDSFPVPLTNSGKEMLNEAYGNRFFWRINLVGLRQRLSLLNKKGSEIKEFIRDQYDL